MKFEDLVKAMKKEKALSSDEVIKLRFVLVSQWDQLQKEFEKICIDDLQIKEIEEYNRVHQIINFDTEENENFKENNKR